MLHPLPRLFSSPSPPHHIMGVPEYSMTPRWANQMSNIVMQCSEIFLALIDPRVPPNSHGTSHCSPTNVTRCTTLATNYICLNPTPPSLSFSLSLSLSLSFSLSLSLFRFGVCQDLGANSILHSRL